MSETNFIKTALTFLRYHPSVAWAERMNTGKIRKVRFGFKGLSDIIGQLKTGEFLAIELKDPSVKNPDKHATLQQLEFINMVINNGGYAGIANCIEHLEQILDKNKK